MTGINVDPTYDAGAPAASALKDAGFTWVRLVSRPSVDTYARVMLDSGIYVLAVVTEESGGYICPADAYQIGNEPDAASNSGPNAKSPADFVAWWNLYRDTYPDLTMIGPGLASGQPWYWQQIQSAGGLRGAAGFAVHPYNKDAYNAGLLLQQYEAITPNLALWVTEWNRPVADIPEFKEMLRTDATMDAFFCWQPYQNWGCTPEQRRAITAAR